MQKNNQEPQLQLQKIQLLTDMVMVKLKQLLVLMRVDLLLMKLN